MKTEIEMIKKLDNQFGKIEKQLKRLGMNINLFSILKIQNRELKHSIMLAYLLDSFENHGLYQQMLKEFLKYFSLTKSFFCDYQVFLEYQDMDIVLKADDAKKLICIENKVWSSEHDDQLSRYYETLEQEYPDYDKLFVYLTPMGIFPKKARDQAIWKTLSYRDILKMIQQLDMTKVPTKIKLLIEDYQEMIKREVLMEKDELKKYCMEVYLKHKKAFDTIMENVDVYYYSRNLILNYLKGEEELIYDEESSTHRFLHFKTKTLEKNFPKAPVYYEIYLNKDFISISLIFLYPKKDREAFYKQARDYIKRTYRTSFASYKETSYYVSKKIGGFDMNVLTMDEESDQEYIQVEMDQIKNKILEHEERIYYC